MSSYLGGTALFHYFEAQTNHLTQRCCSSAFFADSRQACAKPLEVIELCTWSCFMPRTANFTIASKRTSYFDSKKRIVIAMIELTRTTE